MSEYWSDVYMFRCTDYKTVLIPSMKHTAKAQALWLGVGEKWAWLVGSGRISIAKCGISDYTAEVSSDITTNSVQRQHAANV